MNGNAPNVVLQKISLLKRKFLNRIDLCFSSKKTLSINSLRGSIFESFIIADIYKQYFNFGKRPPVYFWRDLNGRIEIDCIIEEQLSLFPIEIKSS